MVRVSVVLPAFNCEQFVLYAIDSIFKQTFQDMELIIIEDGSTDRTFEKVMSLNYSMDTKIIVHKQNQGLSQSLNDGLRLSTGDYIAIQHGDDLSLPERLEKQVCYLDTHPNVYLVSTWMKYIDERGRVSKRDGWWLRQVKRVADDPKIIRQKLLEMNCLIHTSVMFRRDVIDKVGYYELDMPPAEDYSFWLRITDHYDAAIIREVLCYYRTHSQQISNSEGGELMKRKAQEALKRTRARRR